MRTSLSRLLLGWLLMLGGGCLMLESGLADAHTANRTLQTAEALGGVGLAAVGVILRRGAMKRARS